jgi:hypothetical protein
LEKGNTDTPKWRLEEAVREHVNELHQKEWDEKIARWLPEMRKKSRTIDGDLALQLYCNEDISDEERNRRFDMLDQTVLTRVLMWCNARAQARAQEGWHSLEDCQYTDEMFESIRSNIDATFEALDHIPALHVEKRRQAFGTFWRQRRQAWEENFLQEVRKFKANHQRLGQFTLTQLSQKEEFPLFCLRNWQMDWSKEADQVRIEAEQERITLRSQCKCSGGLGYDPEFTRLHLAVQESKEREERKLRVLAREWSSREKSWRTELTFYKECAEWVKMAPLHRFYILHRARTELKSIEKQRDCELRELFPLTVVSKLDETPGLNAAIMKALESRSVPKSPADYLSSRGIGDIPESTRPAQNQVKDWNVLGTRGLEAVIEGHLRTHLLIYYVMH